jgi:hypothetical protein
MMDQKIKKKWIEALRSGEYEQTHGQLSHDNKFCCLGVLMCVQGIHNFRPHALLPPRELLCGLNIDDVETLTALNDGQNLHGRHTFKQIADYLERERSI